MDSTVSIMLMFNGNLLDAISTLHSPTGIHFGGRNFHATQSGSLTKPIHHLPLPKDKYHFHPKAVTNLVSMAIVSDHHCIVMDTDVDNAIYVFNSDGTYI